MCEDTKLSFGCDDGSPFWDLKFNKELIISYFVCNVVCIVLHLQICVVDHVDSTSDTNK